MESTLDRGLSADPLARSLGRIARCPKLTAHLHRVLGAYCHESRNLLNSLKMSFYLVRRGDALEHLNGLGTQEDRYEEIERFIDRLHQLCRPLAFTPLRIPLDFLFDERTENWTRLLAASGRRLCLNPPADPVVGAFDPGRLGPALDDLVEWRARRGRPGSDLGLSWSSDGERFLVDWYEVARGRDREPSTQDPVVREGNETLDVTALFALPLLTRVVALHSGDVSVKEGDRWALRLSWPLEPRTPLGQTSF